MGQENSHRTPSGGRPEWSPAVGDLALHLELKSLGERHCEPTSESLQCKGTWKRRGGKEKALLHIYFCRERREAPTSVKQERDAITNREIEKLKMQFAKIKVSERVIR